MNSIQLVGVSAIILGILAIVVFAFSKVFSEITEIPPEILFGIILIFGGMAVVLVSLVRERMHDIEKEGKK